MENLFPLFKLVLPMISYAFLIINLSNSSLMMNFRGLFPIPQTLLCINLLSIMFMIKIAPSRSYMIQRPNYQSNPLYKAITLRLLPMAKRELAKLTQCMDSLIMLNLLIEELFLGLYTQSFHILN